MDPTLTRVAAWVGRPLDPLADRLLDRYQRWLVDEALPAGGVGPGEAAVLVTRHLGDSLAFARAWRGRPPASIVDLGSGVGLPGIPLAITHPDAQVTLVDRSGRRVRLMERARRVLDLGNLAVAEGDIRRPLGRYGAVVARAAMPPDQLGRWATEWAAPGAPVVVAGSTKRRPTVAGWSPLEIPTEVLDPGGWLLIMAAPLERS